MYPEESSSHINRRSFVKQAAGSASVLALSSALAPGVHAAGGDELKIGLVGCGGRGSGAASQALTATDTPVKLWAMGDLFPDQIEKSYAMLSQGAEKRYDRSAFPPLTDKMDVPPERRFSGFDSFQKVLDTGVDMVILASPPHFRPEHFEASVKAGAHVFMEKPVAVDPVGIRRILAAAEESLK